MPHARRRETALDLREQRGDSKRSVRAGHHDQAGQPHAIGLGEHAGAAVFDPVRAAHDHDGGIHERHREELLVEQALRARGVHQMDPVVAPVEPGNAAELRGFVPMIARLMVEQ